MAIATEKTKILRIYTDMDSDGKTESLLILHIKGQRAKIAFPWK